MKRTGVGEFEMDAKYRIPGTEDELEKTILKIWDETDMFILIVPVPKDSGVATDFIIDKKELKKLLEKIL